MDAAAFSPCVSSLETIYPNTAEEQTARYNSIAAKFAARFGVKPTFFARAPGRVNLIGEHIDYSGYGVLPMALEKDTVVAVCAQDSAEIVIANTDPAAYTERISPCGLESVVIDKNNHHWSNYFLSGYKGALEFDRSVAARGAFMMVDGRVPVGAGVSSSSALVVAAAMATARLNALQITKQQMATLTQKCEQYVGVEGGGMDQAISCMADAGEAKLIEFNPVRATSVRLPHGGTFVIANTVVQANKYFSKYNVRVVECRFAALVIAKKLGLAHWAEQTTLGKLQTALGKTLAEMADLVRAHLRREPFTVAEIAGILELPVDDAIARYTRAARDAEGPLELHLRALHVYTESDRVLSFKAVCDRAPYEGQRGDLGRLMDESQTSCRDLYDCSCPELDRITELARAAGALGSRLTGAGWGGCSVSLVEDAKVDAFIAALKTSYYGTPDVDPNHIFMSKAEGGAAYYVPA